MTNRPVYNHPSTLPVNEETCELRLHQETKLVAGRLFWKFFIVLTRDRTIKRGAFGGRKILGPIWIFPRIKDKLKDIYPKNITIREIIKLYPWRTKKELAWFGKGTTQPDNTKPYVVVSP